MIHTHHAATTTPVNVDAALPEQLQGLADAVATYLHPVAAQPGRIGVSYSGGVDSATLAALIARAIGRERTVLVMGISPSMARRELRFARRQAKQLGLELIEIDTDELSDPRYVANPASRCYFCRDELFTKISDEVADAYNLVAVAYGENADDQTRIDRPGARAAREHDVLYPLAACHITKTQVRNIASALGIAAATKPAAPCLASRIPHGQPVTIDKLRAIDAAEDAVLNAGFSDCRVRHHGDIARIEVPEDELSALSDTQLRRDVVDGVKAAGFTHVVVDLEGLRSGMFTLTVLNRSDDAR